MVVARHQASHSSCSSSCAPLNELVSSKKCTAPTELAERVELFILDCSSLVHIRERQSGSKWGLFVTRKSGKEGGIDTLKELENFAYEDNGKTVVSSFWFLPLGWHSMPHTWNLRRADISQPLWLNLRVGIWERCQLVKPTIIPPVTKFYVALDNKCVGNTKNKERALFFVDALISEHRNWKSNAPF